MTRYGNSLILLALIESFNAAVDPGADFDLFYRQVWDIYTCTGYGLDIWGRIVDVSRVLTINTTPDSFGFYTSTADYEPFNQAPFSAGNTVTTNFTLADDVYRRLILVKAATNISTCSVPILNGLLTNLFGESGRVWVPSGVQMFLLQDPVGASFSFAEMGDVDSTTFADAPFLSDTTLYFAALSERSLTAPLDVFVPGMNILA